MLISSSTNEKRKSVSVLTEHHNNNNNNNNNNNRGAGGRVNWGTDRSAVCWASGGTRPRAPRPGQPCAGQTGSCVDLAARGFLPDTSGRC